MGGGVGDSHHWAGEFAKYALREGCTCAHLAGQIITSACISAVSAWGPVERRVGGPLTKQRAEGKQGPYGVSRTTEVFNPVVTCSPRPKNKARTDSLACFQLPIWADARRCGRRRRKRLRRKVIRVEKKKEICTRMMHWFWYSLTRYRPIHVSKHTDLMKWKPGGLPSTSLLPATWPHPWKARSASLPPSHVRLRCDQNKLGASAHHSFVTQTLCDDWLEALARIEYLPQISLKHLFLSKQRCQDANYSLGKEHQCGRAEHPSLAPHLWSSLILY